MSRELADEIERHCESLAAMIAEAEKNGTRRYILEGERAASIGFLVADNLPAILAALRAPRPADPGPGVFADEAVERAAECMYRRIGIPPLPEWRDLTEADKDDWRRGAKAALAAALPQPASDMRPATDAASVADRPAAGDARAEVERAAVELFIRFHDDDDDTWDDLGESVRQQYRDGASAVLRTALAQGQTTTPTTGA